MTLALVIAFSALVLLLALALLWSAWPGWLKGGLVVAVTVLYFYGLGAVHAIWGIPSDDALPERFLMLAAAIQEPTPKTPGALFVWVSQLRDGKPTLEPRAFRLPYTRELHSQINDGIKKGRDGVSQLGTAEIKNGKRGAFFGLLPGKDEQEITIRDLPSPQLPEK